MFVIEVPYFSLDQTFESMQVPRWIKLKDSKYVIPFKDRALKVEQQKERLIMSCNEDDFFNIWFDYFDLSTDYYSENRKIRACHRKFKIPANRGKGIHIIKQDDFESYIYGSLIERLGFVNARLCINQIAATCGVRHDQSMKEAGRVTWYEFPTPAMILENIEKLPSLGSFINDWLFMLCKAMTKEAIKTFESINKHYRLFAKHDVSMFPTEGIEETIKKNFNCSCKEFEKEYLCECDNKGLAYLYILNHVTNRPKELTNGISRQH